jgi:outer membrane scaffolding protein for murein synthesis (MipA/OmpV family)
VPPPSSLPVRLRACLAAAPAVVLLVNAAPCPAEEITHGDPSVRRSVDIDVEKDQGRSDFRWLLGASLTSAGEYAGSDRRDLSFRPLVAVRYGRLKLASSGSSSLLDFGAAPDESGASLDLLASSRWKLRAGLRIGGGRPSSDSPDLAGLPDVRKTVLARGSAGYLLTPDLSVTSTLSWDLLGRDNGASWSNSLDYRRRLRAGTELRLGLGVTFGNATHMNSFYGVPLSARTADRPYYRPGSGLKDAGLGVGFTSALTSHWIAFGGVSYTRLLDGAADSPLTKQRYDTAATLGIAWKCCR